MQSEVAYCPQQDRTIGSSSVIPIGRHCADALLSTASPAVQSRLLHVCLAQPLSCRLQPLCDVKISRAGKKYHKFIMMITLSVESVFFVRDWCMNNRPKPAGQGVSMFRDTL